MVARQRPSAESILSCALSAASLHGCTRDGPGNEVLGAVYGGFNLPPGARTTTLESKTNFLGAAPAGSSVLAECTPVHRGKTTSVWQTAVRAESGKLLALVTQTQLVIAG